MVGCICVVDDKKLIGLLGDYGELFYYFGWDYFFIEIWVGFFCG